MAGPRVELVDRLQELIKLHREQDAFPAGAAYQIQEMLAHLGGVESQAALQFETLRILEHKPSISKETQKRLRRLLGAQVETAAGQDEQDEQEKLVKPVTPAELVNELILAKFLANAENLAEGK